MNVVLEIPDAFAERLQADGDVSRQALEALVIEGFRSGRLSKSEVRRLLGFGSRPALDDFFAAHGLAGTYTEQDRDQDREDLRRIGL